MYFDCPKLCRKERSKRRNGWRANGLVWKGRASTFWCEFGHLYGGGSRAQTATFSLLQGRKEASHDVNSHQCLWWEEREREREGEGERERERVLVSPAQAQGVASPGGAQSIRRPGEWCEVWCLLCHGKTAAYEGRGAGPRNACGDLRGLLFPPSFQRSHVCRHTNTDVRHHKLNKMNGYMLQF